MQKQFFLLSLIILCLFAGCRGRKKTPLISQSNLVQTMSTLSKSTKAQTINVYIENSGSMDGYVNGKTEFKGAIRDLLVDLKYYYGEKNIRVYFINSDIHSTDTSSDLATFSQNINTLWFIGAREHSKLNNIFKQVLDRTNNETISILFSDYIYSIKGENTRGLLNDEKSLTKDAFLTKWKKAKVQLATTIVKMKSKFDGKYFPYTGDSNNFQICMERPYYICVIGNQEILKDFNQKIELNPKRIEGFENKYVLSSGSPQEIYYSVLNASFNQGRFATDRENSGNDYVHGIKNVSVLRGLESIIFAIAVDFKDVQAEDDYICNPENYQVVTENFKVTKVFPVKQREIDKSDWNTIKGHAPTHIILIESTVKKIHDSEITIMLKKQMPQWVMNSHTEDDTGPSKLSGKTFGLKYWIEGIYEAYETIYPNNKNYFECTITIK